MNTEVKWLRASYITGAIADGLIAILMLIPARMGEIEFRYPMGLAASLMFGWTLILIWGNRKPMERKGILLLTIFPVITGLIVSSIYAVTVGIFPLQKIIPSTVLGLSIVFLMGFSYIKARAAEKQGI